MLELEALPCSGLSQTSLIEVFLSHLVNFIHLPPLSHVVYLKDPSLGPFFLVFIYFPLAILLKNIKSHFIFMQMIVKFIYR